MSTSLDDVLSAAKVELARLREREHAGLVESGLQGLVHDLMNENEALADARAEARKRVDALKGELAAQQEHAALLQRQIKGARARIQKLKGAR